MHEHAEVVAAVVAKDLRGLADRDGARLRAWKNSQAEPIRTMPIAASQTYS